jgi:hypothetical protein
VAGALPLSCISSTLLVPPTTFVCPTLRPLRLVPSFPRLFLTLPSTFPHPHVPPKYHPQNCSPTPQVAHNHQRHLRRPHDNPLSRLSPLATPSNPFVVLQRSDLTLPTTTAPLQPVAAPTTRFALKTSCASPSRFANHNVYILPFQRPPAAPDARDSDPRLAQPPWRAESQGAEAIRCAEPAKTVPGCQEYEGAQRDSKPRSLPHAV